MDIKEPIVLCDICNSIADVNSILQKYGVKINEFYPAPVDLPEEEWLKIFMEAEPYPGARELLHSIEAQGLEIIYVTSRPHIAQFVTFRWLDIHKFPVNTVVFNANHEDKIVIANELNAMAVLDDDPRVITGIRDCLRIVKEQPYNKFLAKDPNILFIKSFADIMFEINIKSI